MAAFYEKSSGSSGQDLSATYFTSLSIIGALFFTDIVGCILSFLAASWIKGRTNWSYVRSCAIYMFIRGILGIALAVFALSILNKEKVKAMFKANVS
jgi:uncharacterized membrane protein